MIALCNNVYIYLRQEKSGDWLVCCSMAIAQLKQTRFFPTALLLISALALGDNSGLKIPSNEMDCMSGLLDAQLQSGYGFSVRLLELLKSSTASNISFTQVC